MNTSTQTVDQKPHSKQNKIWAQSHDCEGFVCHTIQIHGVDFDFIEVPQTKINVKQSIFWGFIKTSTTRYLSSYFMMSHPVTQQQWSAVMHNKHDDSWLSHLPAINISYSDVSNRFLPQLNHLLRQHGYKGGFRLPTNSEWQNMGDQNFPDHTPPQPQVHSCNRHDNKPHHVKSATRGDLGAWMLGNVWEMVGKPNKFGFIDLRGGDNQCGRVDAHLKSKSSDHFDYKGSDVGFRLLRFQEPAIQTAAQYPR